MTDYKYKYGHGYKEFSLPEEHVLGELKMKQMPPLENLKAAVLICTPNTGHPVLGVF